MPATILVSRTVAYVQRYIRQAPLTFSGTNDPAFGIGDWVRNLILSAPFAWRWNRATATQTCVIGQNDYTINLPNFGWLEQAYIVDTSVTPNVSYSIAIQLNATKEVTNNQPTHCAPWMDDDNGNITFRLTPPPDKAYTLNLTYQNASPTFKSLNDSWAPIPDYMQNVVQELYLAKAFQYIGDERFASTMQMAIHSLVGVSEGLTESQKNIFLSEMLGTARTQQASSLSTQYGNQSRNLI